MRVLRRWLHRLLSLPRAGRRDDDLAAELDSHFQLHIDDNLRAGMSPDEARRAARLAFGPVESVREQYRARTGVMLIRSAAGLFRDALRTVTRQRLATVTTIAVLSCGVGTTASVLGLVDVLLFRPPAHVRSPERLVAITGDAAQHYIGYEDLTRRVTTLDLAAVSRPRVLTLGDADRGRTVRTQCVTASYAPLLGVQPALGRMLAPADEVRGVRPAAVISDGLWRRQFGGDRGLVGTEVLLAGVAHVIIGVAPPEFRALEMVAVDTWLPLTVSPELCSWTGANLLQSSSGNWLTTIGRLKDGISLDRAQQELHTLSTFASAGQRRSPLTATPIQDTRRNRVSRDAQLALWLAGGTSVVLLIACTNIAGLLAVRAAARRREMAVRVQLGATRARLFGQLLVENLLVSATAAVAAVFVAAGTRALLQEFMPAWSGDRWLDPRSTALLAAFALGAGLLSGIVPAAQTARVMTAGASHTTHAVTRRRSRIWNGILVAQVALALILSIGAGLFVRSTWAVTSNLGYEPDKVVLVTVDLQAAGIRRESERRLAFDAIFDRVRSSPLVASASLATSGPLQENILRSVLPRRASDGPSPVVSAVSPSYFVTTGTRILRGRSFTDADDRNSPPVAIVDSTLAAGLWPDEDVLDRCQVVLVAQPCIRIVGVSEPRRGHTLAQASQDLFLPLTQALSGHSAPEALLVRPRDSVDAALPELAAFIRGVATGRGFVNVQPLESLVNTQARSWRLGTLMFGACGAMAVIVAALGLFVSLQLAVQQRTAEFGVRLTLGASPVRIAGMVLRQGLWLVLAGAALGVGAALLLGDSLRALLYGVAPTDMLTLVVAPSFVAAAALLGCLAPAVRAARVDPMVALRTE